jgi:hypothetical protein
MEDWIAARYAEIEAIKAEIEGMIAENQSRICQGEAMAYKEDAFQEKAKYLWGISNYIMKNR